MTVFSTRRSIGTTLVLLTVTSSSYAQSPPQGFFSIGAAAADGGPNLYVAGGIERRLTGILSIGADAGMMFDPQQYVLSALIGGGTNYWFRNRFGVRLDARAALAFGGEGGLVMATMGIIFR